jgi:hypothetical protein
MTVSKFELLPDDILFEIFGYLSHVDIFKSFVLLNERFSRILINEYLWHIHIDGSTMSLPMFNHFYSNALKGIGARIISLRITFSDMIDEWSLVSSSLNYHQTTLLRCLHLIDIDLYKFDKLLNDCLIKQLHTLLVDVTCDRSYKGEVVEGTYLAKVRKQK